MYNTKQGLSSFDKTIEILFTIIASINTLEEIESFYVKYFSRYTNHFHKYVLHNIFNIIT